MIPPSTRPRVLVVDDKESLRDLLVRLLEPSCDTTAASSGEEALDLAHPGAFDVIVSDIRMPGLDGLELLARVKEVDPDVEVILVTAYASVQSAVEAIRAGAYDYLPKPFDADDAIIKVTRAAERKALKDQARRLMELLDQRSQDPSGLAGSGLIGRSEPMRQVFALIDKAARRDLTVLVTGPSGTGKELVARAIHLRSAARAEPFVAINCGAIPESLLESELFGHVRGAFSGANSDKRGLFEEAGRGTVFLDELGELPLALQVKLNRALQERELRRVGDTRTRPLTARVITATNRELTDLVQAGTFREDLYYRVAVFPIALPPLSARLEDVPLLAQHFLSRARTRIGGGPQGMKPEVLRALLDHPWPGHVRELENAMERAAAVAEGPLVTLADLPEAIAKSRQRSESDAAKDKLPRGTSALRNLTHLTWKDALVEVERRAARSYFRSLLEETSGNVSEAAKRADLARESMHRLMRKHGLSSNTFRKRAPR
jgi:DNA-binding NtrC family response regulator